MSDRVVTGIRLLRAVFEAQRAHDAGAGRTGRHADAEWCRTNDLLAKAKSDLAAFEASTDEDWKLKQSGDL